MPRGDLERSELLSSALRLSYFTVAWNGLVGSTALVVGLMTGSLALAGFALNALLDSSASAVLVWRFNTERLDPGAAERVERQALTWIAVAMLGVAVYVGFEAGRSLKEGSGSHPESSVLGLGIAAVSLAVLPWLALRKLRVASRMRSQALRGDGVLTSAAAALAAITLFALLVNSAFEWWWADPAAALLIASALGVEGMRVAIRHRFD